VNISNSFAILVSGVPAIDKKPISLITHGGSGAPDNWNLVCRIRYHNSTWKIYDEDDMWPQLRQRDTKRNVRHRRIWPSLPLNQRTCFSLHIGESKWGYVNVYQISVDHWLHPIFISIINTHTMESSSNQYSPWAPYSLYHVPILHQLVRLCW